MDAISVRPTRHSTQWTLATQSIVGVLHAHDVEVRIAPKIPISNLLFLLGYATEDGWQPDPSQFDQTDDLVDAMAIAFATHDHTALEHGLLQGYTEVDAT